MRQFSLLIAVALVAAFLLPSCAQEEVSDGLEVSDKPYELVFDTQQDMQFPELPTGCEATAASTLARMAGAHVTKTEVADLMPKSDSDFVHSFLGNPYAKTGWATSAPCVAETLNKIFQTREQFAAIELTGTSIYRLPLPCMVWISIDLVDNGKPRRESEGYGLFNRSHCVVITDVHDGEVDCIDPLKGITEYPFHIFKMRFDGMGKQSVYVGTLDKILNMTRGEK